MLVALNTDYFINALAQKIDAPQGRVDAPPHGADAQLRERTVQLLPEEVEAYADIAVDDNLLLYGKRYRLSERECEVLRYVLVGKDNQNIASAMHLALSTVKVHVHNILQKTGHTNRQELIQDFWKTV